MAQLKVEINIGGVWTDVTADVRAAGAVTIQRGRQDEQSLVSYGRLVARIGSNEGKYVGRNPLSPYFGLLGRNTPIRVSMDGAYRFHGEVSAWPPRQADSGGDVTIPLQASGILRRLGGSTALPSPVYREVIRDTAAANMVAYWPCEDSADATQFASALPSGSALSFTGDVLRASSTDIPGSKPLPVLQSGANFVGTVPATPSTTGAVYFRIILSVPDAPSTPNGTTLLNIYVKDGNTERFEFVYGTGGTLAVRAIDSSNAVIDSTGALAVGLNGQRCCMSINLQQSGSTCFADLGFDTLFDDNQDHGGVQFLNDLAGVTIGRCFGFSGGGSGQMDGWAFGHIGVGNINTFMFFIGDAMDGYIGETAGDRMIRIAEESSIPFSIVGDAADTAPMGAQIQGSVLDVLRSCEAADAGILLESRNQFGLTYRTRTSLYNQAGPTLTGTGRHITVLEPVEDDQALANDITVSRVGGSSARAELPIGKLSVQEPPDGAGRYVSAPPAVGVQFDSQLPDIAGWQLHLGTWDEQRFSAVGTELVVADATLSADLAALDSGDRFTITKPPEWLPPDDIGLLVQGYTETIGEGDPESWKLIWNATPAGPFTVAEADGEPRVDTDGSELAASLSASVTSFTVNPTSPQTGLWTTDAADFPMDIVIGGERITLSAISGTTAPQTFTASARSVNGVVKAHPSGAPVTVADPAYAPL
jgi:hypothetical protein